MSKQSTRRVSTRLLLAVGVAAIAALLPAIGSASTYQINWHSINSGGGLVAGGSYKLNSSVGQPTAGFVQSIDYLHWVGFWAGQVPDPTPVPTIGVAKLLPDGTLVSIAGKVATTSETDFADFFYVEESDRTGGIRVSTPGAPIVGLIRGTVVNVIGVLDTTSAGERQITGPMVIIVTTTAPLGPLGMCSRSVGGGDWGSPPLGQYGVHDGYGLNNVGLLIHTWGRVELEGPDYVLIDDGSDTQVRIDTTNLVLPPTVDEYVSVIGISSLYQSAPDGYRFRFVLPRTDEDIARH